MYNSQLIALIGLATVIVAAPVGSPAVASSALQQRSVEERGEAGNLAKIVGGALGTVGGGEAIFHNEIQSPATPRSLSDIEMRGEAAALTDVAAKIAPAFTLGGGLASVTANSNNIAHSSKRGAESEVEERGEASAIADVAAKIAPGFSIAGGTLGTLGAASTLNHNANSRRGEASALADVAAKIAPGFSIAGGTAGTLGAASTLNNNANSRRGEASAIADVAAKYAPMFSIAGGTMGALGASSTVKNNATPRAVPSKFEA